MSTTEAILERVTALLPEQQKQVLEFVESLSQSSVSAAKASDPYAWMKLAMDLKLSSPPDMSEHLDDYLYGYNDGIAHFRSTL